MSFFERLSGHGYICAHRGARSIAPENTMLSLEEARRCGSDLWEADVQFTADGELVVFHDNTLERTTDVADHAEFRDRKPWEVADFTLSELQMLNLGDWFIQSDPFGTIAEGIVQESQFSAIRSQKISRLEEVLRYCRQYNFPFNLEIKDQHDRVSPQFIATTILDQLKVTGMEELTLVSSFNHDYLRQIKVTNSAVNTAALVEAAHPDDLVSYLKKLQVEAYHPDWHIADADLILRLKEEGIRVNLWTVNDMDKAREFIAAGAVFICTDWPQQLTRERHST